VPVKRAHSPGRWIALTAAAALALSTGCNNYDKPRRPLPEHLEFRTLDGETLRRSDLLGKPWVINLWVPG
jgi:hypothetical protein